MRTKIIVFIATAIFPMAFNTGSEEISSKSGTFNTQKDLLLVQFDCKTDVDDIHTMAALATLMTKENFSEVNYHVVTGTYGIQGGLYVPPNDLLQLAFRDNWTDAHKDFESAVNKVKELVKTTLKNQGDVWIAEAGQSNFTAEVVKAVKADIPEINISQRIHVVQHGGWNEKMTSPAHLRYVKDNTDYHKIPDGNVVGNGSPGFRSPDYKHWQDKVTDPRLVEIWQLAIEIANKYNGKDGRYNNEAISAGGLDFSDLSEVCWILGLKDIKDTEEFFNFLSD
ncbi:MAG: hypothetical protein M0Q00_01805 [Acholeplasmataceae bacterium]|nr:hypothetical protein [Acholeplasmataceae bacterium]